MTEKQSFMRVDEVAQELGVSKSYAYKIVQKLNAELKKPRLLDHIRQSQPEVLLREAVLWRKGKEG